MTETDLRLRVVSSAVYYLGCKEADGSHKKIIDLYNSIRPLPRGYALSYSDPWCAGFVSAVGHVCSLGAYIYPECSCDAMIQLYRLMRRWCENDAYTPSPGDIIMYDWQDSGNGDCTGGADHVGIIRSVSGNMMTVIEGNLSDAVGERHIAINARNIRGYCLPDYARAASELNSHEDEEDEPASEIVSTLDTSEDPAPAEGRKILVLLHELCIGDIGEEVRAAQLLLIGRGYSCGGDGPDGDFGPATRQAVLNYQIDHDLEPDGIIGTDTFSLLLKSA